jgi:hypothetical protein
MDNGAAPLPWSPPAASAEAATLPEALTEAPTVAPARRGRDGAGRVNWFIPLVFVPLVIYAIAATAVAGFIYLRWQSEKPSLFDQLPDVEGDTPGVRKEKRKVRLVITRELALTKLPEHLRVKLGDTIQVGDLRVTPVKVERRKVALLAANAPDQPEPSPHDALVLTLRLKNTADDYAFTPLDNYFDRAWKPGNDEAVPLTVLQTDREAFFGGPAKWFAQDGARRQEREWLHGRKNVDRAGLAPGEEAETIVATDGWDPAIPAHLFGADAEGQRAKAPYRGKLLWRVQIRRGLVEWRGKDVPATAVIGVEFDDRAYSDGAG